MHTRTTATYGNSGKVLGARLAIALAACSLSLTMLCSCAQAPTTNEKASASAAAGSAAAGSAAAGSAAAGSSASSSSSSSAGSAASATTGTTSNAAALRASLNITEDYRQSFRHGDKSAPYQKYIVLHDTESSADASSVVDYWDSSGAGVAAHFVVNRDGSIVQCVDLDTITHHAGFGDAGHNALYGVEDESRDDKVGTVPIGSSFPDYGMNSYSVGIEMCHVGGSDDYPEAQLVALDKLIAYIDAYYGFQSTIIDHKAWRSGNSDTSPEFATYLANYQATRTHTDA